MFTLTESFDDEGEGKEAEEEDIEFFEPPVTLDFLESLSSDKLKSVLRADLKIIIQSQAVARLGWCQVRGISLTPGSNAVTC